MREQRGALGLSRSLSTGSVKQARQPGANAYDICSAHRKKARALCGDERT